MSTDAWCEVFPEVPDRGRLEALLAWIDDIPSDLIPSDLIPSDLIPSDLPTGPPAPEPGQPTLQELRDDGVFGAVVAASTAAIGRRAATELQGLPIVGDAQRLTARLAEAARRVVADEIVRPLMTMLAADRAAAGLPGRTPQERYERWLAALLTPAGRQRIDTAHPDLLPRATGLAEQRVGALVRMLTATSEHWSAVAASLRIPHADRVVDVEVGGDSHGGGHSVLVLTTSSGARCVLKPRPAAVESAYAEFSAWLGHEALGLDLPRPVSIERAGLTWMEHVAPGAHRHPDYFTMVGVHLAALHVLRGTDIHYENLIADRHGRPVVIDAEALFTPRLGAATTQDVNATGLLSMPFGEGFDFGALDYRAGSTSPFRAWHVEGAGTDEVRFEMRSITVDTPGAVQGAQPTAADAAALCHGLAACLARVAVAPTATLDRVRGLFPKGRVRMIHRPTMAYALVSRMATHPRFTADADRQRVLGRLAVLAPETDDGLLASEIRQLTAGEIPAFGVEIHDDRVLDARGRDTGVRTAARPFDDVAAAILAIDADHVARQVEIARASVAHWQPEQPEQPELARG